MVTASVESWGLLSPYDPQAAWERYFQERAALDWWTAASRRVGDQDDREWEARPPLPWPEDFPQPGTDAALAPYPSEQLTHYHGAPFETFGMVESLGGALRGAVERVAAGCPRVEAATPGLAAALGRGAYFLAFDWEDGDDDPREVDYTTRLYSPCGQAKSIDFNYVYYCRSRSNSVEYFCTCKYTPRGGADCQPAWPLAFKKEGKKTLLHDTLEDCGCARSSNLPAWPTLGLVPAGPLQRLG